MTGEVNKELRDLKTQMAGATSLHETRTTDHIVQINPPVSPPGAVDMRKEQNQLQVNPDAKEEA
ncbi:MAG: hypothetical protein K0S39_5598 [Paenibacillus sp.]|jgi:hypothetical protein|nr:hypothetical protein [Paenibacillus sp.]